MVVLSTVLVLSLSACSNQNANSPLVVAVEATKMNVLYQGVENPIKVAISGISASEIEATIDNGKISGTNGNYIVVTEKTGTANLNIGKNGKVIKTVEFKVFNVPDPTARFAGFNEQSIKIDDLSKLEELVVTMPQGFTFDIKFQVTGFTIIITHEGYTKSNSSNSSILNADQKELLKLLRSGQTLLVTNIKAIGPDGNERLLSDVIYRIN